MIGSKGVQIAVRIQHRRCNRNQNPNGRRKFLLLNFASLFLAFILDNNKQKGYAKGGADRGKRR